MENTTHINRLLPTVCQEVIDRQKIYLSEKLGKVAIEAYKKELAKNKK